MPLSVSVREQVLQALFAAVQTGLAADGGAAVAFERNRRPPAQVFPSAQMIDADGDEEITEETGVDRCVATVTFEGEVQGAADADLGPALNLLEARVLTAALADPLLGGLAVNMTRAGVARAMDREGSPPTAAFSAALQVEYWTRSGRPFEIAS